MVTNLKRSQQYSKNRLTSGFTLIELIVGMVVLSISFSLITSLILPLNEKSAEQLHQVRASELGQSMMNEILSRAFDDNSDMVGGLVRCGEEGTTCTNSNNLGSESGENVSALFDDVDDYIDFDFSTEVNALGDPYLSLYPGFSVNIKVCYSNFTGICSNNVELAKLIVITVTTPQDFDFIFSFYKANA